MVSPGIDSTDPQLGVSAQVFTDICPSLALCGAVTTFQVASYPDDPVVAEVQRFQARQLCKALQNHHIVVGQVYAVELILHRQQMGH